MAGIRDKYTNFCEPPFTFYYNFWTIKTQAMKCENTPYFVSFGVDEWQEVFLSGYPFFILFICMEM